MSDDSIKKLQESAEKKLAQGVSKEEALRSLQQAGILDSKGDFTASYQNLGRVVLTCK